MTTTELIAAVCSTGGLGMLQRARRPRWPSGSMSLSERERAFGVNFVPPLGQGTDADVELAASRAPLVEFFYSAPDPRAIEKVHAGGALACWQVGSVEEARRASDAGCDVIVVQGVEAGGHVRGTTALPPLLSAVLEIVTVPVVAAGGIVTGRSVAAALAAGASGVRLGTRLLATTESGAHPDYLAALLAAGNDATVLTSAFSGRVARRPASRAADGADRRPSLRRRHRRHLDDGRRATAAAPAIGPHAEPRCERNRRRHGALRRPRRRSGIRSKPAAQVVSELTNQAALLLHATQT